MTNTSNTEVLRLGSDAAARNADNNDTGHNLVLEHRQSERVQAQSQTLAFGRQCYRNSQKPTLSNLPISRSITWVLKTLLSCYLPETSTASNGMVQPTDCCRPRRLYKIRFKPQEKRAQAITFNTHTVGGGVKQPIEGPTVLRANYKTSLSFATFHFFTYASSNRLRFARIGDV